MREWLRSDDDTDDEYAAGQYDTTLHSASAFAQSLDGVIRRLAMARIPLTLFKLQFVNMPPQLAHNVAVAVCGESGLLGCLGPNLFLVLDLGPRAVDGITGSVQRLGQRVQRIFAGAPSLRSGEVRISALPFLSDEGRTADLLLSELNERRQSTIMLCGRMLSAAATTAAEPARWSRLPPGPAGGFASATVIPLPKAAVSIAASGEG